MTEATEETPLTGMTAFDVPPPDPIALFATWLKEAEAQGVEATTAALATVDGDGMPSSRTIRILHITERGFVFSSHSVSQKGRDAEATGVGSVVLWWPRTAQQICMSGWLAVTPEDVSDELWAQRDSSTYPMSVATVQSATLEDIDELRARAARLVPGQDSLPRPPVWVGYELVPTAIEFWHNGTERLHRRLRYDLRDGAWHVRELQP